MSLNWTDNTDIREAQMTKKKNFHKAFKIPRKYLRQWALRDYMMELTYTPSLFASCSPDRDPERDSTYFERLPIVSFHLSSCCSCRLRRCHSSRHCNCRVSWMQPRTGYWFRHHRELDCRLKTKNENELRKQLKQFLPSRWHEGRFQFLWP